MWLLVFICMSTVVGGVPIHPTQEAASHAADNVTVTSVHDEQKPATTGALIAGAVILHGTKNVTTAATKNVTTPATKNVTTAATKNVTTAATKNVTTAATKNVTTPATKNVTTPATKNVTTSATVGAVTLHGTKNVTTSATGTAPSILAPQRNSAEILEELQNNLIVQEGDILLPEDRNAVETLWSDATIPYIISDELADQVSNIHTAFTMISSVTCITFKPYTTEMNYLVIKSGKGCASFVGCRGGAQPLYYGRSCSVGNLCHELIHTLGLHHEHTRKDRDQYINVNWQNIIPGREKNFNMKRGNTLNLPYDLNSIMHYGEFYFSQDGSPTMLSKQSGMQIGQRTHLSHLDVQRLNKLYHCDERMKAQLLHWGR